MWLTRVIETKKAKGITTKMMSERTESHIPPETITRILTGKTECPRIDTVLELGASVGLSPWELFAEPTALVAYQCFLTLQTEFDALKAERDTLVEENAALKSNVLFLKEELAASAAENERLRITIAHKDEIIEVHKFYNKLK